MLPLLTKAAIEKMNSCTDWCHTRYHWRPQITQEIWIHTSRHIIINTDGKEGTGKSWMGRGHWISDICCYGSELLTLWKQKLTRLLSCSVQSASSLQCHGHCLIGKTVKYCHLKVNIGKLLFWSLLVTGADGRRAGLTDFIKLGEGWSVFNCICSSYIWAFVGWIILCCSHFSHSKGQQ